MEQRAGREQTNDAPRVRAAAGVGGGKERVALMVAVGSLLLFAALAAYLLRHVGASDLSWARRVYVFAAVEAVAFAAVGWLFGREVHRERAESAEHQAEKAQQQAGAASSQANRKTVEAQALRDRAQLLKQEIRSAQQTQQARQPPPHLQRDFAAATLVAQSRTQLDDLAAKAERLFPENGTSEAGF